MIKVGVIGAGAMGSGIGQVAAMAGHEVFIYDSFTASVAKARDGIMQSLNKLSAKGKLSDQDAKAVFGRIYFIENAESIRECGLVIEAIIENEEEKKNLFRTIETAVDHDAIIASNTSSLSISGLANSLKDPERFIGIHFFNPPVLMKLVEIIPALQTSPSITSRVTELIKAWDKTPVIAKDTPGFIVNRIARPYYGEALRIVEEHLASPQLVDNAMKEIGGFRMGPFELMDFIGNDINEAVTRSVWTAMHYDTRYTPSQLQSNMVRAGWLGRKSGKGFYNYEKENISPAFPATELSTNEDSLKQEIFDRILGMLINEAADALYRQIATREDIDLAMTLGVNYPMGLLKWADEIGIASCVRNIDRLYDLYKEDRYRCSPGLRKMTAINKNFY